LDNFAEEKRKFKIAQLEKSNKFLNKIIWNLRILEALDAISWFFLKMKLKLMIKNMEIYNQIYETVWDLRFLEIVKQNKEQIATFKDGINKIYNTEFYKGDE